MPGHHLQQHQDARSPTAAQPLAHHSAPSCHRIQLLATGRTPCQRPQDPAQHHPGPPLGHMQHSRAPVPRHKYGTTSGTFRHPCHGVQVTGRSARIASAAARHLHHPAATPDVIRQGTHKHCPSSSQATWPGTHSKVLYHVARAKTTGAALPALLTKAQLPCSTSWSRHLDPRSTR